MKKYKDYYYLRNPKGDRRKENKRAYKSLGNFLMKYI